MVLIVIITCTLSQDGQNKALNKSYRLSVPTILKKAHSSITWTSHQDKAILQFHPWSVWVKLNFWKVNRPDATFLLQVFLISLQTFLPEFTFPQTRILPSRRKMRSFVYCLYLLVVKSPQCVPKHTTSNKN